MLQFSVPSRSAGWVRKKAAFATAGFAVLALSFSSAQAADFSIRGADITLSGDVIVAFFSDMALYNSAGRERQAKIAQAMIGADIDHRSSGWGALLELNLAVDEPKVDKNNSVYTDYYKNIGSDLYYYGNLPLRNAYLRYRSNDRHTFRFGRMVNVYGLDTDTLPFWGRWGSPHMLFLDKGINTGFAYGLTLGGFQLDAFAFTGQDRPDRGGNYYLKGLTDPQVDGNSYPGYEAKVSYTIKAGSLRATSFASYHHDRNGSAPGTLYSGKHNDYRTAIGVDAQGVLPIVNRVRWRLIGQRSVYEQGLSEKGGQGRATPLESRDIKRDGYFVTAGLGMGRVSFYLTYEKLDRADVQVWDRIANFDPSHPAMNATESRQIYQLSVRLTEHMETVVLYRKTENPFLSLSNINAEHGDDMYAVYLRARI